MEVQPSGRRTSRAFLILLWIVMFSVSSLLLAGLFVQYLLNPSSQGFSSADWSGYVVKSDYSSPQPRVTSVNGSWIVPAVAVTPQDSFSAAWVGIGGQVDNTLIQVGTEHDSISGVAQYSAWYELLPNDSITIPQFSASPGDKITASIRLVDAANDNWLIQIRDVTTGQSFSQTVFYSSSQLSAEWILERPTVDSTIATLSDFGSITFTDISAVINTTVGTADSFPDIRITMSDGQGNALVNVSSLSKDGTAFTVTYLNISAIVSGQANGIREIETSRSSLPRGTAMASIEAPLLSHRHRQPLHSSIRQ